MNRKPAAAHLFKEKLRGERYARFYWPSLPASPRSAEIIHQKVDPTTGQFPGDVLVYRPNNSYTMTGCQAINKPAEGRRWTARGLVFVYG